MCCLSTCSVSNLCTDAFARPGIVRVCISDSADPVSRTVFRSVGFFFLVGSPKEIVLVKVEPRELFPPLHFS